MNVGAKRPSAEWKIRWLEPGDCDWLETLLRDNWGGESLIVRGIEKRLFGMPTLVAGQCEGMPCTKESA